MQLAIGNRLMAISLLTLVGRNSRRNCIIIQELRHFDLRSIFPQKSPFRPLLRAFYAHSARKSALRAEAATHRLALGKPDRPPTSTWPLFSRPHRLTLHRPPPTPDERGGRSCANRPPLATAIHRPPD